MWKDILNRVNKFLISNIWIPCALIIIRSNLKIRFLNKSPYFILQFKKKM